MKGFSIGSLSLRTKFTATFVLVIFILLVIVISALYGSTSYESSSELLFKAVKKSNAVADIKAELAFIHNSLSLQLIDGNKRSIQTDPPNTILYKWLEEGSNCTLSSRAAKDKDCDYYKKAWIEYLDKAKEINQKYVKTDPTLGEYLTETHEGVYKLSEKKDVSITRLPFYAWINNEKKINLYDSSVKVHLDRIKEAFNKAAAAESGDDGEKNKQYKNVLRAIEDGKDGLQDISDKNEKYAEIFKNRLGSIYSELDGMFIKVGKQELESLHVSKENQKTQGLVIRNILIIISFMCLIVVVFAIWFLIRTIVNPILAMKGKLEELSSKGGDLTVSLPVLSNDEIGGMTISLNDFLGNLRRIISKVKYAAEDINSISGTISEGTNDASARISDTSAFIDDISSKLSSISIHLTETERSMEDVNNIIVTVSKKSDASSKILDQALESMKSIQAASDQIQNVTEVVNEIAFQTNLLSLNAAIEAARAGDYGKGFAVVAEEVRALSQRSSEAAQQIKTLINNAGNKIQTGAELVKNSSDVFIEILSEFRHIFEKIKGLSIELKRNTNGVVEVDKAVNNIRDTINSNAAFIEEMAATSQEMANHTNGLHNDVDKFKV